MRNDQTFAEILAEKMDASTSQCEFSPNSQDSTQPDDIYGLAFLLGTIQKSTFKPKSNYYIRQFGKSESTKTYKNNISNEESNEKDIERKNLNSDEKSALDLLSDYLNEEPIEHLSATKLKEIFRKLAKKYHPDTQEPHNISDKQVYTSHFINIINAYQTLIKALRI